MINKILMVCLIGISGMSMHAQPIAKSYLIGGNIVLRSMNIRTEDVDEKDGITQISIAPMIGFLVTDRMAIGLDAGVTSTTIKRERVNTERRLSETVFFVSPFLRYYLTSGKAGIFTEGSFHVGLGKAKLTTDDVTEKGDITNISVGISPGIYCYISPKIALEFSAGWVGYRYESEASDGTKRKTSQFGFDLGTTGLSLGAMFIL